MAAVMVLAAGSTGDVEPFAALAGRLAGRGHDVTLAADAGFERLAPGGRVGFAPIRADFRSLVPAPGRKRPSLREEVFPVIRGMPGDSWTVARSSHPEVIVARQKSLAAPHLAERLGIPHVQALTVPMLTPTREFPLPGMVRHDLGGLLNRESYRMTGLLTRPYAGVIRGWRAGRLNLAPRGQTAGAGEDLVLLQPEPRADPGGLAARHGGHGILAPGPRGRRAAGRSRPGEVRGRRGATGLCRRASSPRRALRRRSAQPSMTPPCTLAPPNCRSGSPGKTALPGLASRSRAP